MLENKLSKKQLKIQVTYYIGTRHFGVIQSNDDTVDEDAHRKEYGIVGSVVEFKTVIGLDLIIFDGIYWAILKARIFIESLIY